MAAALPDAGSDSQAHTVQSLFSQAVTYHRAGSLADAARLYQAVLELSPSQPDALNNLGVLHMQQGRFDDALQLTQRAVQLHPGNINIRLGHADVLLKSGDLDGALKTLAHAEQHGLAHPRIAALRNYISSDAVHELLVQLFNSHNHVAAVRAARSIVSRSPADGFAWNILSATLTRMGALTEADEAASRAVALMPDDGSAHYNQGIIKYSINQFDSAVASLRKAVALDPTLVNGYACLGNALMLLGQHAEAASAFRQALALDPQQAHTHSNLLFLLGMDEHTLSDDLFAAHRAFADQFESPLRQAWPAHTNSREEQRRLKVGFVSSDLARYAVAHFVQPILTELRKLDTLDLHVYYSNAHSDDFTQEFMHLVPNWHNVHALSDEALAEAILADQIDILVDLHGHTSRHRLLAFARKPAPIQVSWIGYPGTTGLQSMDYYITDPLHLPPGRFDHHFSEKLVYLPASAPFVVKSSDLPEGPSPLERNGYITFGSFNAPAKISETCVAMWCEILKALPESRMYLGAMHDNNASTSIVEWFEKHGVPRSRLSLHERCSLDQYLAQYLDVDVCLDTYPYNGGTTTLHGLWMGVPTLTLAGEQIVSRTGAVAMGHVQMSSFVAETRSTFIQKGIALGAQTNELKTFRKESRSRLLSSPIGQPQIIAAALNAAFRQMWIRWCRDLPPAPLHIQLDHLNQPKHIDE